MKVDMTKVMTPKTYKKKVGKSLTWIYKLMREGELKTITIDGKKFIQV